MHRFEPDGVNQAVGRVWKTIEVVENEGQPPPPSVAQKLPQAAMEVHSSGGLPRCRIKILVRTNMRDVNHKDLEFVWQQRLAHRGKPP
jgi:hypothetical protein